MQFLRVSDLVNIETDPPRSSIYYVPVQLLPSRHTYVTLFRYEFRLYLKIDTLPTS